MLAFLQLEQYQGQLAELQEAVDYVRALNEVIQQCFRPLSSSEENLENLVRDQRGVGEGLLRRGSGARKALPELAMITSGPPQPQGKLLMGVCT